MKILVRLPNWLGDMVMSTGFMNHLHALYPDAQIDVIAKKGIDQLCDYFSGIRNVFVFDKKQYPGLRGAGDFGTKLSAETYDLAFCLPDSFSSAFMMWRTGAKHRLGFKKEMRSLLLTKSYRKPANRHRVDQYVNLLEQFADKKLSNTQVALRNDQVTVPNRVIVNINSEAVSRRLPVEKAVSIIDRLRLQTDAEIIMVGSPKEVPHVTSAFDLLKSRAGIVNLAGSTDLIGLINLFSQSRVMLTTDSGPMHLANALGVHTVALVGAGDEKNTAPYNKQKTTLLRYGQLPCEPCVRNTCKFGKPECLLRMDEHKIVQAVLTALAQTK